MSYTPRLAAGWLSIIADLEKREAAQTLSHAALAARGDPKVLKKLLKELSKD